MTAVSEITNALAAHLDGWPFIYTSCGVNCITIQYDLYQGADAALASTAREIAEFDTRIVIAAKVKIQANHLIRLECFRSVGVVEPTIEEYLGLARGNPLRKGATGAGRLGTNVGSIDCDISHPDSLKNILTYLYQHLRAQGYSEQCPEFP